MALQKAFTHPSGASFPEAYHRVFRADINRKVDHDGTRVEEFTGAVSIFMDSTTRLEGKLPVQSFQFAVNGGDFTSFFSTPVMDQTNVNVLSQTYDWIKTQTNLNGIDYTDSTDV